VRKHTPRFVRHLAPAFGSILLVGSLAAGPAAPAAGATTPGPASDSPNMPMELVTALPQRGPSVWAHLDGIGGKLLVPFNDDLAVVAVPDNEVDALGALPGVASVAPMSQAPLTSASRAPGPAFSAMGDAGSLWNVAQTIGATRFWNQGYTGAGVDVAVIDTGVAPLP